MIDMEKAVEAAIDIAKNRAAIDLRDNGEYNNKYPRDSFEWHAYNEVETNGK